jgi:hypothetical protein
MVVIFLQYPDQEELAAGKWQIEALFGPQAST